MTHQTGNIIKDRMTRTGKPGGSFLYLTRQCDGSSCPSIKEGFDDPHVMILSQDALCPLACHPESPITDTIGYWPVTCLNGRDNKDALIAGCSCWAATGGHTRPVIWKDRQVGTFYEDEEASYLVLADLIPSLTEGSRPEQTQEVLESLIVLLRQHGMAQKHLVRTWFYLDHILDWYDVFNQTRNRFFKEHGVFDSLIPASTGIGCANSHQTALVAKTLAIKPKNGELPKAAHSPLQSPATDYKSAFSRAVEISFPSHKQLYISGTASIDASGRSTHQGDIKAQFETTMRVVGEILESNGYDWTDTARSIAYVRHPDDLEFIRAQLAGSPLSRMPYMLMQADICRDELLFELELDAFRKH